MEDSKPFDNEERITRNLLDHEWSTRFGRETPEDYSGLIPVANGYIKPLLVVSFPMALTQGQLNAVNSVVGTKLHDAGWKVIVLDAQQQTNALAFGINGQLMEAMPLDRLIDLLEGLKRVKEAQV